MVQFAKSVALNIDDQAAVSGWRRQNQSVSFNLQIPDRSTESQRSKLSIGLYAWWAEFSLWTTLPLLGIGPTVRTKPQFVSHSSTFVRSRDFLKESIACRCETAAFKQAAASRIKAGHLPGLLHTFTLFQTFTL